MTRLLKQQQSITVYRLLTKENKLPFSLSACSKQTEFCRFRSLFNGSCRFSLVPFSVYTCTYTRKTRIIYKCMYNCICMYMCIYIYCTRIYDIHISIHTNGQTTNFRWYDEQTVTAACMYKYILPF